LLKKNAMLALSTVSFVIPVRNDAQRLSGCLDSIADSDYPAGLVETIVVDNCSTDGSDDVARGAGAVVMALRTGAVASLRNEGAARATGDILAFVDADHRIDPGWLRALARSMQSSRVAAAGAPYTAPPHGTWVQRLYDGLREHHQERRQIEWLGSGNLAVRRTVFEALGGFDAALATCEDVDLCERLRAAGHAIISDPGMRSVHLGDPATLKGLFFGELWRGRDNLRASFRGPRDFRHLRSALAPVLFLGAVAIATFGTFWGHQYGLAAAACGIVTLIGISSVRATYLLRRTSPVTMISVVQALVVALTYDLARSLALVVRVSHRTRRFADGSITAAPIVSLSDPVPRVSFVIPVRDDARRLNQCLESIRRNDYLRERVEVIVVDDRSLDRSALVALNAGATVIEAPRPGCVAASRNAGAEAATGEILAFVDADHEIDASWVRHMVAILSNDRIAATGAPCVAPAGGNWVQHEYDGLRRRPPDLSDVDWLGGGNFAVKRCVFTAIGGFDRSLRTCEDVDFCRRLRRAGHRIVCASALINVHLGDPSSLTELFFGELWRGRDNFRASLRGPWSLRALPSAIVPVIDLGALGLALYGLAMGSWSSVAVAGVTIVGLASIRATRMLRRDRSPTLGRATQGLIVALVYDIARAFAPWARAGHRRRRSNKASSVLV
jgi:glycosyltransferase involved in cell wall biosynthesis